MYTYLVYTGDDQLDSVFNNEIKAKTRAADLRRRGETDVYIVREDRHMSYR